MTKKKEIDLKKIKPEEMMKYEIAKELGLFDRVLQDGWGALSAKETGRIGGIMTRRRAAAKKEAAERELTNIESNRMDEDGQTLSTNKRKRKEEIVHETASAIESV